MADSTLPTPTEPAPAYQVLARKYRPRSFAELIGQEAMVQTLRNAFATGRIAQAYMLTGVRGIGKTTTARILARALNFELEGQGPSPSVDFPQEGVHCRAILESRHVDVMEMDAASHTGVDDIRDLIEAAHYRPLQAKYKVFIIDEVHMLSKSAFNALLKTLEEPPPEVKFIFATTEINKVPVTVLSRCQRFDLRRLDTALLAEHLGRVVATEGVQSEPEALNALARAAEGSVRDALSLLDQAIAHSPQHVTLATVTAMLGLADRGRLFDLLAALMAAKAPEAIAIFDDVHQRGCDPVMTMQDLARMVHALTRLKAGAPLPESEATQSEAYNHLAPMTSMLALSRAWQVLIKGAEDMSRAPDAKAAADMILLRLAYLAHLPDPATLARLGTEASASGQQKEPLPPLPSGSSKGPQAQGSSTGQSLQARGNWTSTSSGAVQRHNPQEHVMLRPAHESQTQPIQDVKGATVHDADELIALIARQRDIQLVQELENDVVLGGIDDKEEANVSKITMALLPSARPDMPKRLAQSLQHWTGRRWLVDVRSDLQGITRAQKRRADEEQWKEQMEQDPLLRKARDLFPQSRLLKVVRQQIKQDPMLDMPLGTSPDHVQDLQQGDLEQQDWRDD